MLLGAGVVLAAALAARPGPHPRTDEDLQLDWQARSGGQQVLGGRRVPGTPSVQRLRHEDLVFTVTVAPARPGPNLVRVDTTPTRSDGHGHAIGNDLPVYVGTPAQEQAGSLVEATPRPGTGGLWAVLDLPPGTATVLVTHGPAHRLPFAIETGSVRSTVETERVWAGADGPECLAATTSAVLAGGTPPARCPAQSLSADDASALRAEVATLARRGVTELAVRHDGSARGRAAYRLVRARAGAAGVSLVAPDAQPGPRNALLVVSGWDDAATQLSAVSARPLDQEPVRSDGTWLAPWLLAPGIVDATANAVLALDFDIRDPEAQEFSQSLVTLLPGQAPTSTGYAAWRGARGGHPNPLTLYAASRAAYLPAAPGYDHHDTQVAWFPGGTVTPVGRPAPTPAKEDR